MAARFAGDAPPGFSAAHTALSPIGSHEIAGQHGAQGCHVAAGAAIAHDADGLERQEGSEGLAGEVVSAFAAVGVMAERSFSMEKASVWRSRTVYSFLISPGMCTYRPEPRRGAVQALRARLAVTRHIFAWACKFKCRQLKKNKCSCCGRCGLARASATRTCIVATMPRSMKASRRSTHRLFACKTSTPLSVSISPTSSLAPAARDRTFM